jgi:hypothetical protein
MREFLKQYGHTLGPIGVPMTDGQAFALDTILKDFSQEDRELRRLQQKQSLESVDDGERADISWITQEVVDKSGDVVLIDGMDDTHFRLNPLVTINHAYWMPAVGRSIWREKANEANRRGIKAKTVYPPRPNDYVQDTWQPDEVFALIKAGLLNAKSMGFIGRREEPTPEERERYPGVRAMVRKWYLIEYCVCPLGDNPRAIVQMVSKSAKNDFATLLGVSSPDPISTPANQEKEVTFTSLSEVEEQVKKEIAKIDFNKLAEKVAEEVIDKYRGIV